MEPVFWAALAEAAAARGLSEAALIMKIDAQRNRQNLSSAIRVWLFEQARAKAP
jgi:predicted DNA-binding ribbon-helix-helix protein